MIIAHHVILTGYGHWLPNDPRGSLSREFRIPELQKLGEIHFGRKKQQPELEAIKAFHRDVAPLLKYPVLWFQDAQRQAIGDSFGEMVRRGKLTCYGCAVLRNHAHLVIRRHRLRAQEMMKLLRTSSRNALASRGLVPIDHPLWSLDPYVAYKDTVLSVQSAIAYVQSNPAKHRLPPQSWDFVAPYDRWPFHRAGTPQAP